MMNPLLALQKESSEHEQLGEHSRTSSMTSGYLTNNTAPWAPKHPTQREPTFAPPLPEIRPSMASTDAEAQQQLMSESTPMATSSTADHSRPMLPTPTRPRPDETTRHKAAADRHSN